MRYDVDKNTGCWVWLDEDFEDLVRVFPDKKSAMDAILKFARQEFSDEVEEVGFYISHTKVIEVLVEESDV